MAGRKSKLQEWLTPEKKMLLENWAKNGLSDEQICHNIGISKATYYKWQKLNVEFLNSIKKGKEIVDYQVENALFQSALNGNVTAQIFWLKNRMPDKWSDRPQPKAPEQEEQNSIDGLSAALMKIAEELQGEK